MKQVPISMIITTYNDSEYLPLAIESVINQSMTPKQIIIIDDGSASYMPKVIANRYAKSFPEISIEYRRKTNGGASSARNLGLELVTQPYVTFLDADDRLLEGSIEKRFEALTHLGSEYFGVYGSGITDTGVNKRFSDIDGKPSASIVGRLHDGVPGACYYYIFRASAIRNVGKFDENLTHNEDFDFIIRFLNSGMKCKGSVGFTNQITIRQNSLSRNPNYEKTFNGIMKFIDKAEAENYFDDKFLRYRKKYTHLFIAKRALKKDPLTAIKHIFIAAKYIL